MNSSCSWFRNWTLPSMWHGVIHIMWKIVREWSYQWKAVLSHLPFLLLWALLWPLLFSFVYTNFLLIFIPKHFNVLQRPFYWMFWTFRGFEDFGGILEAHNLCVCLCLCLCSILQGCVSKTNKQMFFMEFLEQQEVSLKLCANPKSQRNITNVTFYWCLPVIHCTSVMC